MAQDEISLRSIEGNIYSVETFGTVDGPGIRYILFLQGCPLRCLYCHNPDSVLAHGGKRWTAGEAVDDILKYKNFIKSGGVTLSGGEPLMQPEFALAITKLLHQMNIHVAIDTSGCMPVRDKVKDAIDEVDMLLLDIKAIDPEVSRRLTGQTSDYAFNMLDYCEYTKKPVWIRHVLVNGFTLEESQLHKLAKKLAGYSCVKMIELLPFHKLGEPKWELAQRRYALYDTPATTKEETEWAKAIFITQGLKVQ